MDLLPALVFWAFEAPGKADLLAKWPSQINHYINYSPARAHMHAP